MARYLDPELHELVSHLRSELSEQNSEMRALQAKNEQLQAEIDLMRKMDEPTLVALQQKNAEIERLRAAMNLREEDHKRKTAEIERLREENAELETAHNVRLDELNGMRGEIERLRQRLIDAGISTGSDDETYSHRA